MHGNSSENGIKLSISPEASISLVVFTSLQILVGSFANCIVIITILMAKELKKRSEDLLILNLALNDLLSLLTFLPWHTYVVSQRNIRDSYTYFTYESLNTLVVYCGANAILAIAIDRFSAVVFPLRHKSTMTRRSTFILIALTWGIAIVFGITDLVRHLVTQHPYVDLWFVMSFLLVMLVTTVFYVIIFYHTRKQGRNILNQTRILRLECENRPNHLFLKVTLNTFVLPCLCYATYLPVVIYVVCTSLLRRRPVIAQITDRSWFYSFLFLSSCINPFLYAVRTKRFKRAFFGKIWSRIFHRPGRPESDRPFHGLRN